VSTRRVDRLVAQLGIAGMSKDQVSRLCRGLDDQVRGFRELPLTRWRLRDWQAVGVWEQTASPASEVAR
jgi:transposase-like protein